MLVFRELLFVWRGTRYRDVEDICDPAYFGVIAFAKGESNTQVVPTGPYEPQIPFIKELFNNASTLLRTGSAPGISPPQYFPNSTVAQQPASLTNSQGQILDFVNNQVPVNNTAVNTALNTATGGYQNPVSSVGGSLAPSLEQGILALISGQNPQLAFAGSTVPQAGSALTSALSPPTGGINTGGTPTNPVGNINVADELTRSLAGGTLNPYLDQVVQGATRSLNRNFTDNTLPAIRQEAVQAGQVGGSREGVAQGIAASRLNEDVSDITARLYANAFDQGAAERGLALNLGATAAGQNQNAALETARLNEAIRQGGVGQSLSAADLILQQLSGGTDIASRNVATGASQAGNLLQAGTGQDIDARLQALSMLPALQSSGINTLGAGNQIGLQQFGFDQAGIDDQVARFFYEQYAPYLALSQFQNLISGSYGSSV